MAGLGGNENQMVNIVVNNCIRGCTAVALQDHGFFAGLINHNPGQNIKM
jgi:hypothetical protein